MLRTPWFWAILPLLSLCLFFAQISEAASVRSLSLEELSTRADLIAEVRIIEKKCEKRRGLIHSDYQATLSQVWKGRLKQGAALTISSPGGELGDISQQVPGAAHFTKSERYLLFLRKGKSHFHVLGLSQGAFTLTRNAKNQLVAKQFHRGLELVGQRDPRLQNERKREVLKKEVESALEEAR